MELVHLVGAVGHFRIFTRDVQLYQGLYYDVSCYAESVDGICRRNQSP